MAEAIGGDIGVQILQAVQGLGVRMDRLEARMDSLESQVKDLQSRMTRQETLMEILGAEFVTWRGEVQQLKGEVQQLRTEMHEGFRRVNARLDLTDGTVVLMASVLRRPTELGEELEGHLREIGAR